MMGSSSSTEQNLLNAILQIVTNPGMVQKNIEVLQEQMDTNRKLLEQSQEAFHKSSEAQKTADAVHAGHVRRQGELDSQAQQLLDMQNNMEISRASFEIEKAELAKKILAHEEDLKSMAKEEARLTKLQEWIKNAEQEASSKAQRREDQLSKREHDLQHREAQASELALTAQSKIDRIKSLAHA